MKLIKSKVINTIKNLFKSKNRTLKEKNKINAYLLSIENKNYKKIYIIDNSSKIIKNRNPGIDLGRILAMFAIVIQHIFFHGRSVIKFPQYIKELNNLSTIYFWHVSCFIFISGYVGYKTCKYSNLLYLWFCTLFYSVGIKIYFNQFKPNIYKKEITYIDFFPVTTKQYWYFSFYFGMYLFLPFINKGIENISKSQFKIGVITLIVVYIVLRDYIAPNYDTFQMFNGYSILWHLVYFITGAYFGKFYKDINLKKKIIYCSLYILIYYFSTYLCVNLPSYSIKSNEQTIKDIFISFLKCIFIKKLNSVTMILQSISIILFITTIKYNKYIAKIITFFGPLTYGVYLIHDNNIIRAKYIINIFNNYSKDLPLSNVKKIIYLKALKIFVICALIDYLRNLIFRICYIKKICILIEKLL